jgi:outer membrane lipoprotein-sorting protein
MSVSLRLSSVICIAILALLATAEAVNTSRPQADSFAKKLAIIKQHSAESPKTSRRTTVTEGELNSWFVYRAPALLPVGVKDPRVTVVGNGKLVGVVTVDLDDVGKSKSGAWNVLGGRVPISLSGVLRTKDGRGQFDLQSADISGVPVPRFLVQEILSHYTRDEDRPNGVRLDDPFALPASIKQIDVGSGQAVILQ